jgi:hypothetical protein
MANHRDTAPLLLPAEGFVRMRDLVGSRKKDGQLGILPVTRSCIATWVAQGKVPPAIKLSPKVSGWPVRVIRELIERIERDGRL